MAIAFVLETIAKTGKPMSALCAEIPRYALVKQKVKVPDAEKAALIARLRDTVPKLPGVTRSDVRDGVKAWFKEGWVLVRPSGTEPIVRIQAEAKDEATAQKLADRVMPLIGLTA